MNTSPRRRHASLALSTLSALILAAVGLGSVAVAQDGRGQTPDLGTLEAEYDELFAAAIEVSESEPMRFFRAWSVVLDTAMMVERLRLMEESDGSPVSRIDSDAVRQRVFDRWRQARPGTVGPELLAANGFPDPAQRRAVILALLDRHPDDFLVVHQAWRELQQSGETVRATELLESFLARNPDTTAVYELLVADAGANATRRVEILERWNRASPGDPKLVTSWLSPRLAQPDPATLAQVLSAFFAREPKGQEGLTACLAVYRSAAVELKDRARACIARLAVDPASPPGVAQQAQTALAGLAAEAGDWSELLTAIDRLEPDARWRALLSAATGLKAPERCRERVQLLESARSALLDEDSYKSLASVLRPCPEEPAAQTLFLGLVREAPPQAVPGVVRSWVTRVNESLEGELPEGIARLLEARLEEEEGSSPLFEALDLVYEVASSSDRRFDLLRRWYEGSPETFGGEQATAFAEELWVREERDSAIEVLVRTAEVRWQPSVSELLWRLWVENEQPERAKELVRGLLGSDDPWRLQTGHRLAARSSALRDDLAGAEEHYWKALQGDLPRQEDAVEMLSFMGSRMEQAGVQSLAVRICEETHLGTGPASATECAADLLQRAGRSESATLLLDSAGLPDDPTALFKVARTAESAGRTQAAERAFRRVLEVDPRNPMSWSGLGGFLERQGRVEELQELLDRARDQFPSPPVELYRAAGRALTAAGKPRAAIDALIEAREALPDGAGGDWSRSWIDHELRAAYRGLGSQLPRSPDRRNPPASPSFQRTDPPDLPSATPGDLRAVADALYSGSGGQYDPATATELYWRAASMGDALAQLRLALLIHLDASVAPSEAPAADELYRRSSEQVRALAAEGNSYAEYLLGTALLVGLGGPADPALARPWLERAAAGGESWAWHNLGWMKSSGRGFPVSPDSALAAYRQGSRAGNVRSMLDFAYDTLTAEGTGPLCEEGLKWLQHAAHTGNARAANFLGEVLFFGRSDCVASDPEAAIEWLEAAATAHQPGAKHRLGLALLFTGGGKQVERALALLEESAESAEVLAVETLAFLHATGALAVPREPSTARRYLAEAARLGSDGFHLLRQSREQAVYRMLLERGLKRLEELAGQQDASARAYLSRFHFLGLGGSVDPQRTIKLARLAAAEGEALAMRTLSQLYQRGEGVEADEKEAMQWQQRCAEAGDSFCMMFHAQALREGKILEQDLEASLVWLERAAATGNWWATADMGRLHDEGWNGLPRDPAAAVPWKRRLAELGDPEARGWLAYYGYGFD